MGKACTCKRDRRRSLGIKKGKQSLLVCSLCFSIYKESEKKERDMDEKEKQNVSLLFLNALI